MSKNPFFGHPAFQPEHQGRHLGLDILFLFHRHHLFHHALAFFRRVRLLLDLRGPDFPTLGSTYFIGQKLYFFSIICKKK